MPSTSIKDSLYHNQLLRIVYINLLLDAYFGINVKWEKIDCKQSTYQHLRMITGGLEVVEETCDG